MKKYEKIRIFCIIIGSVMLVLGCYMMMTRGNPLDEMAGYVGVSNGKEIISVDGYKYSYNNGNNSDKTDNFVTIENAENIPEIDYYPGNDNYKMEVSFTEDYSQKPTYKVYDEDFNCIVEEQSNLQMPGEIGKKYYIELSVDWGKKNKSLTIKYYFVINIKE